MLEVYWGCFIGGALFVLVTVIFGDVIGTALDGLLDFLSADSSGLFSPLTLVGGITIFGGTGILLEQYTPLVAWYVFILSVLLAIFCSILLYFFYVKPMARAENSMGYSIQELVGQVGEVTVTIPASGYGEVMLKFGIGRVHRLACSYDQEEMVEGSRIVVVEVREGTLYVVPFRI